MSEATLGTIISSRLDLDGDASPQTLAAYLAEINETLETKFLADPIRVSIRACYVGDLHLIRAIASPRRSERTGDRIAFDRHDGVSVQLALAGRSRGQAGRRRVESDPGTIMVLDFAQTFQMTDLEARDVINVAVPRAVLARHSLDARELHGLVFDQEDAALLRAMLEGLAPRLDRLPINAGPVIADMLIDLVLVALRLDPRPTSRPVDRRMALREHANRLIDARLGASELSPEWLASRMSLSRSELYSLFEGQGEGGVSRFIWRRRLDAARAALMDAGDRRRIGEIAFAHGFSSEAHFARAYRRIFGVTASTTRRSRD